MSSSVPTSTVPSGGGLAATSTTIPSLPTNICTERSFEVPPGYNGICVVPGNQFLPQECCDTPVVDFNNGCLFGCQPKGGSANRFSGCLHNHLHESPDGKHTVEENYMCVLLDTNNTSTASPSMTPTSTASGSGSVATSPTETTSSSPSPTPTGASSTNRVSKAGVALVALFLAGLVAM